MRWVVTLPPAPRVPEPGDLVARRAVRRCAGCDGALTPLGRQRLRTAGGEGISDGALLVELAWCPACGRIEMFSAAGVA